MPSENAMTKDASLLSVPTEGESQEARDDRETLIHWVPVALPLFAGFIVSRSGSSPAQHLQSRPFR